MGIFQKTAQATLALALAFAPFTVSAQDFDTQQPEYRTYAPMEVYGTPKASTEKPIEQRDRESILFRALTLSCDQGSISACFDLGKAYELGEGTPQNRPIAAILYGEGCALNHAESCYRAGVLARIAEDNLGASDAVLAFEKACTLRSLDGCAHLALSLAEGEGTAQDQPSAEALWRETCGLGGSEACHLLAMTLVSEDRSVEEQVEGASFFAQACINRHRLSCFNLLDSRLIGQNLPPREEILSYACAAGDPERCVELAEAASVGYIVVADRDYAAQLHRHACQLRPWPRYCETAEAITSEPELLEKCESSDLDACARLGEIYSTITLFRDVEKAAHYLETACASGHAVSCFSVAKLIFSDVDGEFYDGPDQALTLLETSCAGEHLDACESLARELETGDRVAQDKPRALSLLDETCEKGHINSCTFLEQLFWSEPDAPLALANSNYVPPFSPDEQEEIQPASHEENNKLFEDACASSTLTFRGKVFSDRICKPVVMSIGGYALRPGQAPWQALLWRPRNPPNTRRLTDAERVLCGGSLIREGWILTAAHCLKNEEWPVRIGDYRIRLGVHNPRNSEGVGYPIVQVFNHPEFNPTTYAYDIALIRYDPRAGVKGEATNSIARISLDNQTVASRPVVAGQAVYAYGWGWTATTGRGSTSTEELRGVRLLLSSAEDCEGITGYGFAAFCAGGPNGEQACDGDSGGPLITYRDADRIPRVIGVVSSGRACGTAEEVSRYTRVGAVRSWINSVMNSRRR